MFSVILGDMATVVLPYGYPAIQGAPSLTIVYQGTVARLYTASNDPRTESQLFNRKLLSDVSKMRGAAGTWAKSAWKLTFGSTWSSVIYQMVKGDVDGYWSAAESFFDIQSEEWQQGWRDNAPYQATFNDPGRIFFALAQMLYGWDEDHDGHRFYQPQPDQDAGDGERVWWLATREDYGWQVGISTWKYYDDKAPEFSFVGTWFDDDGPGPYAFTLKGTTVVNSYVEIVVIGKQFDLGYVRDPNGANVEIKMNGSQIGFANTNGSELYGAIWQDVFREVMPRTYWMIHVGNAGQVFKFDFVRLRQIYNWIDLDVVAGSWNPFSISGPWGSDGYESTGSGVRAVEFSFVGSYVFMDYRKTSVYGDMRILIDGEEYKILNQYNSSTIIGYNERLGRFPFGLHHCRLDAVSSGQINLISFAVTKSINS